MKELKVNNVDDYCEFLDIEKDKYTILKKEISDMNLNTGEDLRKLKLLSISSIILAVITLVVLSSYYL